MKVEIDKFESGWVGLFIMVKPSEIDLLVSRLIELKSDALDHFHFRTCEYGREPGVADIEISLLGEDQSENMIIE